MTWLITSGSYSAYRVHAAAPDEATARAVIERYDHDPSGYHSYRCEKVPDVASLDDVRRVAWVHAHLIYDKNTGVCRVHPTDVSQHEIAWGDEEPDMFTAGVHHHDVDWRDRQEHQVQVAIYDGTTEDALKMASEAMAQWRAENVLDPQPPEVASR